MFESAKAKYFKKEIKRHQEMLWNLEFQREGLKEMRENIRSSYDRMNETVRLATARLAEEKDEKVKENLKRTIEKYTPDLEQRRKQMEGLDNEIDNEENQASSIAKINAVRAVIDMMESYLVKC